MKTLKVAYLLPILLLCLSPSNLSATTIFSNLGPGDSFGGVPAGTVSSSSASFGVRFEQAVAFTPSGVPGTVWTVDSIDIGLSLVAGANDVVLKLLTDATGQPGSVIETIPLSGAITGTPGNPSLAQASSVINPTLTAGTTYWLTASTSGSGTQMSWQGSPTSGGQAFSRNGAPWIVNNVTNQGAFRLTALVPEPSTLLLLTVSTAALFQRRRNS